MQQDIQQTYNRIASNFSRSREKIWPDTEKFTSKLSEGDSVLDLGCGNGRLLGGIKVKVNYLGIDFSDKLIQEAKRLHPGFRFILADITQPAVWKNLPKFDAVFCIGVLHHLPYSVQHRFVLEQIRRHLKKQGFFYLTVWNLWKKSRLLHHFKNGSLQLKLGNLRWINTLFQHRYLMFCFAFNKGYLEKITRQAGFSEISCTYLNKKGEEAGIWHGHNLSLFAKI